MKKTIKIASKVPGKRKATFEVKAYKISGCLAINYTNLKDSEAGWSVTHLPTGMSLRQRLTLKQARLIIECLNDTEISEQLECLTEKTSKAWAQRNSDFVSWLREGPITLESWSDYKFRVRSERQALLDERQALLDKLQAA